PQHAEAHLNSGIGEHILGNISQAKLHYAKVIEIQPENEIALRNLAGLFAAESDTESAITCFRQLLQINPRMGDAWAELIRIYERDGLMDEARQAASEATRILPEDANIQYFSAKIALRDHQIEHSLAIFKKINPDLLHPNYLQLYQFEYASTLDRAGEYESAYRHFEKANDTASHNVRAKQTDFKAFDHYMDAIEEWLSSGAKVEKYEKEEDLGDDLCFLIGFPRSGTTLLDVMLDGHPKTQALEEYPTFEQIAFSIDKEFGGYPFGVSTMGPKERESIRRQYRALLAKEGIKQISGDIIVDKMPIRTVHVAVMHRLFPHAKFLFALRHPCDAILSNYMQNFLANEIFVHFNSLAESSRVYARVMRIWKTSSDLMPIPVHYVRYEQLVSDTNRTLQEVCRFLDLPWVQNMTEHQNTLKDRGRIRTNSYHQVREPIYLRSLNRWQHYHRQFKPHLVKIKPYADYFSYSLD
ncbi:MAG: tetratricopeptide repeat-containing sulfotransferase family protein, partial [Methylococcales bacterium]